MACRRPIIQGQKGSLDTAADSSRFILRGLPPRLSAPRACSVYEDAARSPSCHHFP